MRRIFRKRFSFCTECSKILESENDKIEEGIMVRHLILWKLKETMTVDEKSQVLSNMKEHLEGLVGKIPGLISLKIIINEMESSNADVMLDSVLESEEALKGYQKHPEHVLVADTYVRTYTEVRMCLDYKE